MSSAVAPAPLDPRLQQFARENNLSRGDLVYLLKLIASGELAEAAQLTHRPVDVQEFVESKEFMGKKGVLYPPLMDALVEICSGRYVEAILTGAIGVGKTTLALYVTAYSLYQLSCYRSPHALFSLDPASEIMMVFQSVSAQAAKQLDYARFKAMVLSSKYFRNHYMFDRYIDSRMVFPNRVIVEPISGSDTGALGANVIGGVIDELNFMQVVSGSRKNPDGSVYDQAQENYNAIAARRKSRFIDLGATPGMLCLVSSRRYPGQFTDRREAEREQDIRETGTSATYLYDKRVWEIRPEDFRGSRWFSVFIGDKSNQPRVLTRKESEHAKWRKHPRVMRVPEAFRPDFRNDILRAIRDVLGQSTLANSPYLTNVEAIAHMFEHGARNVFSRDTVEFSRENLAIHMSRVTNREAKRWAHLDLALSGDAAGLVISHIERFDEHNVGGVIEWRPRIVVDAALQIRPPKQGQINFGRIRAILYRLTELGLPITWITCDGFQSADMLQHAQRQGYVVGTLSADKDARVYDALKGAIYDRRIECPTHEVLHGELVALNENQKAGSNKSKVDHPPNGGKDVADGLACTTFGLSSQVMLWVEHGIPLHQTPKVVAGAPKLRDGKLAGEDATIGVA